MWWNHTNVPSILNGLCEVPRCEANVVQHCTGGDDGGNKSAVELRDLKNSDLQRVFHMPKTGSIRNLLGDAGDSLLFKADLGITAAKRRLEHMTTNRIENKDQEPIRACTEFKQNVPLCLVNVNSFSQTPSSHRTTETYCSTSNSVVLMLTVWLSTYAHTPSKYLPALHLGQAPAFASLPRRVNESCIYLAKQSRHSEQTADT